MLDFLKSKNINVQKFNFDPEMFKKYRNKIYKKSGRKEPIPVFCSQGKSNKGSKKKQDEEKTAEEKQWHLRFT